MNAKIDLTPKLRTANVTIKSDPIVFDFDEAKIVDGIAEAVAKAVVKDIRAQPVDKWDKTGHLASGIRAVRGDVVAPSDRLNRDPALAQRFSDEIPAMRQPLEPRPVVDAIDLAVHEIVGK